MIADDMIHGAISRPRRSKPVESATPIVPRAVATAVWEEACVLVQEELPREWIRRLAVRADTVYGRNTQFHRSLHRQGDAGRDHLWAFTRHWLAAMIWKHRRALHTRLPASYSVGEEPLI